jgi:TfoX/Sxy family transcriptional regulator of competence genes
MANTRSLLEFVVEQLGPEASAKAMFGEHGIYVRGVLIGLFCDDRLFLKPTTAGALLLGKHEMAPPYPGAKPSMVVAEESWDDRELMLALAETNAAELAQRPAKPKRAKPGVRSVAAPVRRGRR